MTTIGHTLGFPRIGLHRELKKALESYWSGTIQQKQLLEVGRILRQRHWKQQKHSGLDLIPVGDFAWYDHVLTTSLMLNNVPTRHRYSKNNTIDLNTHFRISRGYSLDNTTSIYPSEMKKWFNTNYHYIVPEFTHNQEFELNWMQLFDEIDEAISLHYNIKPIILGPISYLWLGKEKEKNFNRLSLLPSLLPVYQKILQILSEKNISWVQIDEPALVLELPSKWLNAYLNTYQQLNGYVKLLLTTYFDGIYHQINTIKNMSIDGLHVDLASGSDNISLLHQDIPKHWILSVGIVNGRNVWKTNLYKWFKILHPLIHKRTIWIGSSCSLLHSPMDLNYETQLNDKNIKTWFSFALQKCSEISLLRTALNTDITHTISNINILKKHYIINNTYNKLYTTHNTEVQERCKNINQFPKERHSEYNSRIKSQQKALKLPIYPTTTIGSFPQTQNIRNIRLKFKNNQIQKDEYQYEIKKYIENIIKEQEKLDLDVLVHGEPERNDMVEYFGENLNGFIFTQNGWVQSYGSRCVKPPIIVGDISRPKPITTNWISYAQSLTNKPIKGILTGPITILSWSFLREDIQRNEIAIQLALSIRDEVMDLEKSGIKIIQIDEPALREGLPLKNSQQKEYLKWAIHAFNTTISSVKDSTQIHTHMCYSKFDDIIHAITQLDVDVITIESSRTEPKFLEKIYHEKNNFNAIGPGIYDIHSPNIPTINDFITKLKKLLKYIPKKHLWVNPDCGLKTRSWLEIKQALNNMVAAAKITRTQNKI